MQPLSRSESQKPHRSHHLGYLVPAFVTQDGILLSAQIRGRIGGDVDRGAPRQCRFGFSFAFSVNPKVLPCARRWGGPNGETAQARRRNSTRCAPPTQFGAIPKLHRSVGPPRLCALKNENVTRPNVRKQRRPLQLRGPGIRPRFVQPLSVRLLTNCWRSTSPPHDEVAICTDARRKPTRDAQTLIARRRSDDTSGYLSLPVPRVDRRAQLKRVRDVVGGNRVHEPKILAWIHGCRAGRPRGSRSAERTRVACRAMAVMLN